MTIDFEMTTKEIFNSFVSFSFQSQLERLVFKRQTNNGMKRNKTATKKKSRSKVKLYFEVMLSEICFFFYKNRAFQKMHTLIMA